MILVLQGAAPARLKILQKPPDGGKEIAQQHESREDKHPPLEDRDESARDSDEKENDSRDEAEDFWNGHISCVPRRARAARTTGASEMAMIAIITHSKFSRTQETLPIQYPAHEKRSTHAIPPTTLYRRKLG